MAMDPAVAEDAAVVDQDATADAVMVVMAMDMDTAMVTAMVTAATDMAVDTVMVVTPVQVLEMQFTL